VIAIGSAETFRELQVRTAALAERNSAFAEQVEHQAATIDVLKVMSSSTNDTQPVFDIILRRAMELCDCIIGGLYEYDGELMHVRSAHGFAADALAAYTRQFPMAPTRQIFSARAILDRQTVHIRDIGTEPNVPQASRDLGYKSMFAVPLLRDGTVIGVISLAHKDIDGFSDAHVELLKTFAEQAVIAIGSVATFRALQERTAALGRSVAELQALEEVLRAVNSSLDLETVLATIIDRAVPLAQADEGLIYEFDTAEQVFAPKAAFGMTEDRIARLRERRIRIGETYLGRSAVDRVPVHVEDVQQDASTPEARDYLQGIHAVLAVPLLREDNVVGGLVIRRRTEGAFAPATVALMQTFAAQCVLAIENARLFDEVQVRTRDLAEALEQQTATADVLKAISRSAYDLDTVLTTLITTAVRITDAGSGGQIFRRVGEVYRYAASQMTVDPGYLEHEKRAEIVPGRGTLIGRVALEKRTVHIADAWNDPDYADKEAARAAPVRAMLGVPLLRDGEPIGTFTLARPEAVPFTERQLELVTTFADQAVIAIENVRLFNEVQARTQELTRSLDELRRAQDRLVQTEKMASLGQLTAGIAHEIKNPLNFVNNFSALSAELIDELQEALAPEPLGERVRTEVNDLTALLKGNLEKVVQHGKRADGIVKNMLLHSRESGGEMRSVDLNATVEEALNLAYHGARAEKPGFNVTLVRDFDPAAGSLELYPQEFTRVLLNLISNGFYAATRKKNDGGDPGFEPTLTVNTEARPGEVAIRVRDNGIGIPDSVRAKMFEPFFTTKPAGEGTGLGLSLSHDIVVKQHGGSIGVDSRVGEFTEITVTIPRPHS
jgi:GAF domain-containing protein